VKGVQFDPRLVVHGDFLFQSGYKNFDYFFHLYPRPSAIFSSNDIMALGLLKRAKEMDIQIPQDMSIVGFDNIPMSTIISPPLTTVHHPIVEMGRWGVHLLLNKILKTGEQTDEVLLQNNLVIRESAQSISK
jgi:DNA-binding LacI/PurR family transcriptional regulator